MSEVGGSEERHVVIIGGGIIGCTTAYYLTHHPRFKPADASQERAKSATCTTTVTVIEASSIASGASGKAGGLVARWAYPAELVAVSVEEHVKLANRYGGADRWGFRAVECGEWNGTVTLGDDEDANGPDGGKGNVPSELDWVRSSPAIPAKYESMSPPGEGGTMQVHPYQFTTSMMELAIEKGAKIVLGTARKVRYAEDGRRVVGVEYSSKGEADDGETKVMDATDVIVAAGPWTSSTLLPTPIPQSPVRAHSICVRPSRPVSAFALFASIQLPPTLDPQSVLGPPQKRTKKQLGGTRIVNPEIYARPNNEIYICTGDAPRGVPFPPSTAQVQVDESVCDDLFAQVSAISREIRDGQVLAKQACYLPTLDVGPRGCPVVGRVGERIGLYVATGHTCWGICNAPGTARALSELVMDGEVLCADLKRLEYRNFV